MSTLVASFGDECRAVQIAAGHAGRHVPPPDGMSVSNWRKVALASLDRVPSADPTAGEMLQAAGDISGTLYETRERSRSGPEISHFFGSSREVWDAFMNTPQQLVRLTNDPANLTRPSVWRDLDGRVVRIEPPVQGGF